MDTLFLKLILETVKEQQYLIFKIVELEVLLFTGFFIAVQSWSTQKLVRQAREPVVSLGLRLRTFGEQKITRVNVYNFSNFPIWIWVEIKLCDDRNGSNPEKLQIYDSMPIPSHIPLELPLSKIDKKIGQQDVKFAFVKYWCSATKKRSNHFQPTEIIFRYQKDEKAWLIDKLGVKFYSWYEVKF